MFVIGAMRAANTSERDDFLRIVISFQLIGGDMIFSENR